MTLILSQELKKYATVNCVVPQARTRLTTDATPKFADIMSKKDDSGFTSQDSIKVDSTILKKLVLSTLQEYREKLEQDPFSLHWIHFSRGAISLEVFDLLIEKIKAEQNLNKPIRHPVQDEFVPGIINDLAAANKARTENTLITLLQFPVIPDDIFRRIRTVSHNDRERIANVLSDSAADRESKTVRRLIIDIGHVVEFY